MAEEERLNHLRQIQERENEAQLLEEQKRLQQQEDETKRQKELELQKQNNQEKNNNSSPTEENCGQMSTSVTTPVVSRTLTDILTPQVVTDKQTNSGEQIRNTIDVLEFESQNQNPFELVEMQTLNELDELRSVLNPDENNVHKHIKSASSNKGSESTEFELSSLFFKSPTTETPTTIPDPMTSNIINITDTPLQYNQNIFMNSSFGAVPQQPSSNTYSWTHFDTNGNTQPQLQNVVASPSVNDGTQVIDNNTEFKNHLGNLLSKTPPPNAGYRSVNNEENSHSFDSGTHSSSREYENVPSLQRTKSLPNLQETVDIASNDAVTFNRSGPSSLEAKYANSKDDQHQQYPTERIESIMKQYTFQRMSNSSVSSPSTQQSSNSQTNDSSTNQNQYVNPIYAQVPFHTTSSYPLASGNFNTSSNQYMNYQPPNITTTANSANSIVMSSSNQNSVSAAPSSTTTNQQSAICTPSSMPTSDIQYSYIPPYMGAANVNTRPNQSNPFQSIQQPPRGMVHQQSYSYPTQNLNNGGPMLVQSRPMNRKDWSNGINLTKNIRPQQPIPPVGSANMPLSPPIQNQSPETNNYTTPAALPSISAPSRVYPVNPFSPAASQTTPLQQPVPMPRKPANNPSQPPKPVPPRRPNSACLTVCFSL